MAEGRSHDRATLLLSLPFGLLWWPLLGPPVALAAGLSFLVGGLWLSPDLDTPSLPSRRWGPLRCLWWPYRALLRHRSLFSHSPVLGTAGRLLYLAALLLVGSWLAAPLGAPSPSQLVRVAQEAIRHHPVMLLAGLAGLEASAWLHLIQDGDPLPRTPRLLRPLLGRRGRRRRR